MKSILYVVAVVLSCAAGYFSYSNAGKQEEQLTKTKDEMQTNARLQVNISKAKKDAKTEEELFTKALSENSDLSSEIDNDEGKITLANRALGRLKSEVAVLDEELERNAAAKKKIEEVFGGANIPLENVPEYVEKLENERKQLAKEHDELSTASEILTGQVNKNRETLDELGRRATDRTASLRGNSVASLITAVNHSWGFVIIKPHPNASITEESKLIVVRGTQHVGRLKINAIEQNRIIADIDYESLAPGVRIQSGDKVILAVSNTR